MVWHIVESTFLCTIAATQKHVVAMVNRLFMKHGTEYIHMLIQCSLQALKHADAAMLVDATHAKLFQDHPNNSLAFAYATTADAS